MPGPHSIAPRIPEINRLRAMRIMRIKPDTFNLAVSDQTFEPGTLNSETLLFYVLDLFPNLFQFGFNVDNFMRCFGMADFSTDGVKFPIELLQ